MPTTNENSRNGKRENSQRPENSIIDFGDFDPVDMEELGLDGSIGDLGFLDIPAGGTSAPDGGETDELIIVSDTADGGKEVEVTAFSGAVVEENIEDFFERYEYSNTNALNKFVDEVSRVIGVEEEAEKNSTAAPDEGQKPLDNIPREEQNEPEPDLIAQSKKYAVGLLSLKVRIGLSALFTLVALWMTVAVEGGGKLPFGIGNSILLAGSALLIMQLMCAAAATDILWRGIRNMFRAAFGTETLLVLSGIFTLLDGMYMLISGNGSMGIPFSAVFCVGVTCSLAGEYCYRSAMRDSLEKAAMLQAQIGVVNDIDTLEGRAILKKVPRSVEGFYRSIVQEDCAESAYRAASPLLLVFAVALAALVSIGRDDVKIFMHAFAALLSVTSTFMAPLAYSLPFRMAASYASKRGAALAGWGGAQAIADSDGVLLVDDDIFPMGTIGIENVAIYGDDKEKAIVAASSLVIASGSGMGRCFAELLRQQRLTMNRVYNFAHSESGGIQGLIKGEKAMVGNSGYMNLMGIRVPPERDRNNAVYLAIGKRLYARFDMTYLPANNVQASLLSMAKTGINMLFAVRDFNVTPAAVKQKFRIPIENIEHLTVAECYQITENRAVFNCDCMAVLGKDGAGAFSAAIAAGYTLRNTALVWTIVSIVGAAVGLLLIFSLFWFGAAGTVQAVSLLVYLLSNAAVQLLLTVFTRKT